MADIILNKQGGKRHRAPAPRVDLTPMVDLGFLLITFFIFTTTMNEPKLLDINMPYRPAPASTAFIDTSSITVILTKDHKLAYYNGLLETPGKMQFTNSIRGILTKKQSELRHLPSHFSNEARLLHVIIKPGNDSQYDDLVSILDEMLINQVPYYTIDDVTEEESNALK